MTPGESLKKHLKENGWTQSDLAIIMDRPLPNVNAILNDKTTVTPETAVKLSQIFGGEPLKWLISDAEFRLSKVSLEDDIVRKRARLFQMAPIRTIQKRGWITQTDDVDLIETEMLKFYGISSVEDEPEFGASMRMTSQTTILTPSQQAWCGRVRQLASKVNVATYSEDKFPALLKGLRKLAAYPVEATKVSDLLAKYGIALVIVEPLPGCKIDGAALWLSDAQPVIGLSIRYDRIDNFWFTLCHELSHVLHRDSHSIDVGTRCDDIEFQVKSKQEQRADADAASWLVPSDEMISFIRRVGPMYSKERLIQFAHRIKMHPGVIVGQLQGSGEMGYQAHKPFLTKIRSHVISTALTDGWGYTI